MRERGPHLGEGADETLGAGVVDSAGIGLVIRLIRSNVWVGRDCESVDEEEKR